MKVGLSGAAGLIGRELAHGLMESGHAIELVSYGRTAIQAHRNVYWHLGQHLGKVESFDVFIHLAHDRKAVDSNVIGTLDLAREVSARNPRCFQVFVSSYSAFEGTKSVYGNQKLELERNLRVMLGDRLAVVRPGLVIGDGSVYKKIMSVSRLLPFAIETIPRLQVVVVRLDDLVHRMLDVVVARRTGDINLFYSVPLSLFELTEMSYGRKRLKITSSRKFLFRATKLLLFFLPRSLVIRDNLIGLIENQRSPHVSSF